MQGTPPRDLPIDEDGVWKMEDKREASRAISVAADTLDGLAYIMDLVYEDMQGAADMRDVSSVVYIARNMLVDLTSALDKADAALDGIDEG